jgi:CDP-paratose synthetase
MENLVSKRILVTGSSGFIGRKLVSALQNHGHEIVVLLHSTITSVSKNVQEINVHNQIWEKEVLDFSPDFVFHLAGKSNYPNSFEEKEELWDANVRFGNTLVDVILKTPNTIFVNFNTSLAYKGSELFPYTYYALTKSCFYQTLTFFASQNKVAVFNLILFNVYGKGDTTKRALNYIVDSLGQTEVVAMSPGEQFMDFVHVDDVVRLCLELLDEKPTNALENIYVGTGKGTTLKEVSQLIEILSNKTTAIDFGGIPYRIEEKMENIAPIAKNRFWKASIAIADGFLTLL